MIEQPLNKYLVVKQQPIFKGLSAYEKNLITSKVQLVEHKKGDILYRQGDPPDFFYCIASGRAKLYVTEKGKEKVVDYVHRGQYFGLISLLTKEPHSVSVKLTNDTLILKISKRNFTYILKHMPKLAIHFSGMLSRRVKQVEGHRKSIFESTIISVYSVSKYVGRTTYAVHLGLSLNREADKKVALVDISSGGYEIIRQLDVKKTVSKPFNLKSGRLKETDLKKAISKFLKNIDVLSVSYQPAALKAHILIAPILTYLANFYHYIIIDLPFELDEVVFEGLRQSDIIHLLTAPEDSSLRKTSQLIRKIKRSLPNYMEENIKVILNRSEEVAFRIHEERVKILGCGVYANLPEFKGPQPDVEYTKAIRRIARQTSGVLTGLVLGSGGALGLSHIGVLKVLEKEKIPIDVVVGSSVGAMIGGLWALGKTADELEKIAMSYKQIARLARFLDLTFPKVSLLRGTRVNIFLKSLFGGKTFYDLRMPFKIVACDIRDGSEVIIDRGDLFSAIRASISIPGVFNPVWRQGRLLVDGGIVNPLPISVLNQMGIKNIIAVNVLPDPGEEIKTKRTHLNIFDIIICGMQTTECVVAKMNAQSADVILHPILPGTEWYEFYKTKELINIGERTAKKALSQIKALLRNSS